MFCVYEEDTITWIQQDKGLPLYTAYGMMRTSASPLTSFALRKKSKRLKIQLRYKIVWQLVMITIFRKVELCNSSIVRKRTKHGTDIPTNVCLCIWHWHFTWHATPYVFAVRLLCFPMGRTWNDFKKGVLRSFITGGGGGGVCTFLSRAILLCMRANTAAGRPVTCTTAGPWLLVLTI
jgi:hypothetical protein